MTLDGNCLLRAYDVNVELLEIPTDFPKSIREMHTATSTAPTNSPSNLHFDISWAMLRPAPPVVTAVKKLYHKFCNASTLESAGQHAYGETNIASSYRVSLLMLLLGFAPKDEDEPEPEPESEPDPDWVHLDNGVGRGKHLVCAGKFLEILGVRDVICLGIEKNAEIFQQLQLLVTSFVSNEPASCSSKIGIACADSYQVSSLEGVDSMFQYTGAHNAKKTTRYIQFMIMAFTTRSLKIITDTWMSQSVFDKLDLPKKVKDQWFLVIVRKSRQGSSQNCFFMWFKRPGCGVLPVRGKNKYVDPLIESMIRQAQTPLKQRVAYGITPTTGIKGIPQTQSGDEVYRWGDNCCDALLDREFIAGHSYVRCIRGDVGTCKETSYLYVGVSVNTKSHSVSFILLVEDKLSTFLLDGSSVVDITSVSPTQVISTTDLKHVSGVVSAPAKRTRAFLRKSTIEQNAAMAKLQESADKDTLVLEVQDQLNSIQQQFATFSHNIEEVSKRQKVVEDKTKKATHGNPKFMKDLKSQRTKVSGLEAKMRDMRTSLRKTVKDADKTGVASLKTQVSQLNTQFKNIDSHLKLLDTSRSRRDKDRDQEKKERDNLASKVTALQSQISGLNNRNIRRSPPAKTSNDTALRDELKQIKDALALQQQEHKREIEKLIQERRHQETQSELIAVRTELAALTKRDVTLVFLFCLGYIFFNHQESYDMTYSPRYIPLHMNLYCCVLPLSGCQKECRRFTAYPGIVH
jgi:hypothetical protein